MPKRTKPSALGRWFTELDSDLVMAERLEFIVFAESTPQGTTFHSGPCGNLTDLKKASATYDLLLVAEFDGRVHYDCSSGYKLVDGTPVKQARSAMTSCASFLSTQAPQGATPEELMKQGGLLNEVRTQLALLESITAFSSFSERVAAQVEVFERRLDALSTSKAMRSFCFKWAANELSTRVPWPIIRESPAASELHSDLLQLSQRERELISSSDLWVVCGTLDAQTLHSRLQSLGPGYEIVPCMLDAWGPLKHVRKYPLAVYLYLNRLGLLSREHLMVKGEPLDEHLENLQGLYGSSAHPGALSFEEAYDAATKI